MTPSRDDEHADAFRRGYEKARRESEPTVPLDELMDDTEPTVVAPFQPPQTQSPQSQARWPQAQPQPLGPDSGFAAPQRDPEDDRDRRRTTMIALLCALAVVLVAGAFGVGKLFADDSAQTSSSAAASGGSHQPAGYDGPVDPVRITDSMASCQADSSVDAAGNQVTYEPAKAHDSDLATAWRCNGSGVGQRYTISLPAGTTVAEVGLVPGYAKTDPVSGVDRYAENNRITKVRWTFDDGSSFVQQMSGDPHNRSMRTLRVPETKTGRVVLEILASQPGSRNTVAISEIRVASPAK